MDNVGRYSSTCANRTVNDKPPKVLAHCYLSFVLLLINKEIKLQYRPTNVEVWNHLWWKKQIGLALLWISQGGIVRRGWRGKHRGICTGIQGSWPVVERHASYEPWVAVSSNWTSSKIERVENASTYTNKAPWLPRPSIQSACIAVAASIPETRETKKQKIQRSFQFLSS